MKTLDEIAEVAWRRAAQKEPPTEWFLNEHYEDENCAFESGYAVGYAAAMENAAYMIVKGLVKT